MRFGRFCAAVVIGSVSVASCHKSAPTSPSESTSLSVGTTSTDTGGITLSAVSLSFGTLAIGQTSSVQTLTITNGSTSAISVNAISSSGDFSAAHACGTTIAASGSCSVSVTFTPQALGTRAGGLTIDDNSSTGPHIVPLDGAGGIAQSLVAFPSYLSFPLWPVGSSTSTTITLTNAGAATITLGLTLAGSGDFSQSNTCSSTLAGTGTCTITVSFAPTTRGSRTATITISDDAPGNPHVVPIVGVAYDNEPTLSLVQSSLFFPSTAVGATSTSLTAQFMNIGSTKLDVYSIITTGDFAQTNSCSSSLAKDGICTMNVTFSPTAAGTRAGAITITSNAAGGPHAIALNGTGSAGAPSGPLVVLSTTGLTFSATATGTPSAAKSVTLRNTGSDALALDGISASGDFLQTNTCGNSLAAGAACVLSITFTPTAPGARSGAVTIVDSAPGSPHSVILTGTGSGSVGPRLSTSPTVVSFGSRTVGVPGGSIDVLVSNPGSEPVTLSLVAASGDFVATGCREMALAAHGRCTITVAFTPTAIGTRTGTLTIVDDAPESPHEVTLTGEGAYAQLTFSPTSLSFSSVTVGSTSDAQTITLTNPSSVAIAITSVAATGEFAVTNDCGTSVGANSSCTLTVTFMPSATGSRSGTLTILDGAPGSPHEMTLKGTGTSVESGSGAPQ